MARMTQALQVMLVCKLHPVALVRLSVIHIRGTYTGPPMISALPTEWFLQQLFGAQALPHVRLIHPVPGRTLGPSLTLWPVSCTPAVPGQFSAPWVLAWTQRLHWHQITSEQKKKSPNQHPRIRGLVAQAQRLRLSDIQKAIPAAQFAVDWKVSGCGCCCNRDQFLSPAGWACNPSSSCNDCNTFGNFLQ